MADRYLVATGNWTSTASWSASSGGAAGASVPGTADNVFLDSASSAFTLTSNDEMSCLNFDCTGFTGTFVHKSGFSLTIRGNLKFVSGMTYTNTNAGKILFSGTGSVTLDSGGKSFFQDVEFNKTSGGGVQLLSDINVGRFISLTTGSFDPNGKKVTLSSSENITIPDAFTFYDLTLKPGTGQAGNSFLLLGNITISNALVLDSNSTDARNRLLISSDTSGIQRTITCNGTVTANYCDFEDIKGAGTASWDLSAATGGSGNCGGNTDITFTTADDCFQVGTGNKNFSDGTIWFTTTGGATAARVPLPQDTAFLDANSTTGTMAQDMQRMGSITCTGFTGTMTTGTVCTCYGSITLGSGMTLTNNTPGYTLAGRGAYTLTCAGKYWAKPLTFDAPGGSYTLQDTLTAGSTLLLTLTRGTFDANNQNVTIGNFWITGSYTRTLSMGSGTWTLSANMNAWSAATSTNLTFNKGTGLLKFTGAMSADRTMAMGTLTYNNFENATTGTKALIVSGAATFNNFKVAAGSKQKFYRSTTYTAATWELAGTVGSPITLASDTTTAATIAKSGGGTVTADYATITYLTGSPASTFYATNSTDGGNNSQITFSAPPGGYRPSVIFID